MLHYLLFMSHEYNRFIKVIMSLNKNQIILKETTDLTLKDDVTKFFITCEYCLRAYL